MDTLTEMSKKVVESKGHTIQSYCSHLSGKYALCNLHISL